MSYSEVLGVFQFVRKMIPILHARSSVTGYIFRRSRCKRTKRRSTTYTTPVLQAQCYDYGGVDAHAEIMKEEVHESLVESILLLLFLFCMPSLLTVGEWMANDH